MLRVLYTWVLLAGPATTSGFAAQPADTCRDWQACRAAAVSAEAAGQMERFHDLAWRTVQLAPKDDPDQLYLLARAQVSSGRPSDALVMLRRLAQTGVATDADTLDAFARVRAREGWAEVEALMAGATRRVGSEPSERSAASVEPLPPSLERLPATDEATRATAVPPSASGSSASPVTSPVTLPGVVVGPSLAGLGAVRLDDIGVASGGFAYDAVSRRFLLGETAGRKIVVVDAESRRTADLVRGDSAAFGDMQAMHIDTRRGDLWVLSNDGDTTTAALHKLQLVAGRPLARLGPPASAGPARFSDLTVTPGGHVLVVDAEGRRLYRALPKADALALVATLDLLSPTAVTAADSESVVYVAHQAGISRVELPHGRPHPVRSSPEVPLDGITRLWWHDGALVVLRTCASGAREAQRLELDRRGTIVVAMQPIAITLPDAPAAIAATLAGDELFVMTAEGLPATTGDVDHRQVVVRRVRLRP